MYTLSISKEQRVTRLPLASHPVSAWCANLFVNCFHVNTELVHTQNYYTDHKLTEHCKYILHNNDKLSASPLMYLQACGVKLVTYSKLRLPSVWRSGFDCWSGWLVGWGLTALLTQNRSYRAYKDCWSSWGLQEAPLMVVRMSIGRNFL